MVQFDKIFGKSLHTFKLNNHYAFVGVWKRRKLRCQCSLIVCMCLVFFFHLSFGFLFDLFSWVFHSINIKHEFSQFKRFSVEFLVLQLDGDICGVFKKAFRMLMWLTVTEMFNLFQQLMSTMNNEMIHKCQYIITTNIRFEQTHVHSLEERKKLYICLWKTPKTLSPSVDFFSLTQTIFNN